MSKLSKVAMTFKNFMELYPDSNIYFNDKFLSDLPDFNYKFTYKNVDYLLSFIEYYDNYAKLHHSFVTLSYNNKVINYSKYCNFSLRYQLLHLFTFLFGINSY